MPAAVTDKFRKATSGTRPEAAYLTATKTIGASSITVNTTTGWATDTGYDFIIYRKDTSGNVVAGTVTTWVGTVSGTTVSDLTLKAGTDQEYASGELSVVIPTVSAAWATSLAEGLLVSHDQDGTLKAGAVDNAAVLASDVVTTAKILDANVTTAKIADANVTPVKWTNPYKFSAYRATNQSYSTINTPAKIQYATERYDSNNNYDTSTYRYTAPVAGFYHFTASIISLQGTAGSVDCSISLYKNGASVATGGNIKGAAFPQPTISTTLQLAASDYIEVYFNDVVATTTLQGSANSSTFEGFLVSQT